MRATLLNLTTSSAVVSTATTGSAVATILDIIPSDIGKLGVLIGLILSLVLIFVNLIKSYRDGKKHKLEMQIMNDKIQKAQSRHGLKERSTD